ncbi:ATP-binding cassette domain-containing protein [Alloacidobacterium dinghuense]|uniref:ATP-binding cassette domain-containing protein n=1 Tax=Alloacidobacterium dinghuense TaxID=2763107 RepID=A0A7G8BP32_9BACT|nr:ATP-binding cassette domain-containing protein [Alloacidobacterium dinghuense]QNI34302.1 ATP-binding cassette domain-containing protein [Alloacidobacterium dinghuense]
MSETAFLTADIEYRSGTFDLHINFSLNSLWTVLFGQSGAGKSTILRILGGLLQPQDARIVMQNHVLLDVKQGISIPAGKRKIGYVTQRPALFPHMTVHRNVAFGLHTLPAKQRGERVHEMLRLFRVADLSERMPKELSGGEYQRVALARALAPEPKLLMLDEPFTGLDADLKESILAELTVWLAARQVPALYVSHDLGEAYQTAADVIVVGKGRIEIQGPVQEVLAPRRDRLLRQLGVVSRPTPAPVLDESQTLPRP